MNALTLYRLGNRVHRHGMRRTARLLAKLNYLIFKCFIPGSAQIGAGTRVAYGGIAVVIHSHSVIGSNCVIGQCVTLGAKEPFASQDVHPSPKVGDNVYIAAGAKLLGGIEIGHSSVIAANAVVTKSVPPHSIVAGIPAKVIGQTADDYRAIMPHG